MTYVLFYFIFGNSKSISNIKETFDIHAYDKIDGRLEKCRAATHDLNIAFPFGSSVRDVEKYIEKEGGFCKLRDYIPLQDRVSLPGDHIYCEITYPVPGKIISIARIKWELYTYQTAVTCPAISSVWR